MQNQQIFNLNYVKVFKIILTIYLFLSRRVIFNLYKSQIDLF